jgi:23S rRNA (guanosine2251-2'-O)-methyltransferase
MVRKAQIVYGRRPVVEILNSHHSHSVKKLLIWQRIKTSPIVTEILRLAESRNIPIKKSDKAQLSNIAGTPKHQGVVVETEPFQYYPFKELLRDIEKVNPFLLILDSITDPQNFGALLRSAEACGVTGVIIAKRRSSPVTTTVFKASAGSIFHLKLARVANLVATLKKLREKGIWVVGTAPEAKIAYFTVDFKLPIAVVLGSEYQGVSRLVREECDLLISIPMLGNIKSLNVSVAGALIMYEVVRQRKLVAQNN